MKCFSLHHLKSMRAFAAARTDAGEMQRTVAPFIRHQNIALLSAGPTRAHLHPLSVNMPWAYRQTFCHVSWHVKKTAESMLLRIPKCGVQRTGSVA